MISVKRLSIEDAEVILAGATTKANEIGVPMCIAVTDDSGNLIAFKRMNGGKAHSVQVSIDKAFTAGSARKATHEYNAVNTPGSLAFGIHTECSGRLSSVGGGIPVMIDGDCVGGIGVSSGTPQQDMDVAEAALAYFVQELN